MPTQPLSAEQLEGLKRYNTPTISNAIELFDVRPRHLGYLPHQIRSLLPELGPIVGYAVTCQTTAAPPLAGSARPTFWPITCVMWPISPVPRLPWVKTLMIRQARAPSLAK